MASFEARTTSTGVQITNEADVRAILNDHVITPDWKLEDGTLSFSGYQWFDLHGDPDADHPEISTLLERLQPYIAEDDELVIQSIGGENCRYLSAHEWVVSRDTIETHGFHDGFRDTDA